MFDRKPWNFVQLFLKILGLRSQMDILLCIVHVMLYLGMPRVNRRLVRTVYCAGIYWHVACWHVAAIDRTIHVYRALIGRPINMRNL
jgi:hypothetical protein